MQNETAMGTEKCVTIISAHSITNTAFITGMIMYGMVSEWSPLLQKTAMLHN